MDLVQPLTEHFDDDMKFSCSVVYLFLHFQHTPDYVLEMFVYSFWHNFLPLKKTKQQQQNNKSSQ